MTPLPETFADLVAQLPEIRRDIAFARSLRQLRVLLPGGAEAVVQFSLDSVNAVLDLRTLSASGATPDGQLPSPTGHTGAALITDGASVTWSP